MCEECLTNSRREGCKWECTTPCFSPSHSLFHSIPFSTTHLSTLSIMLNSFSSLLSLFSVTREKSISHTLTQSVVRSFDQPACVCVSQLVRQSVMQSISLHHPSQPSLVDVIALPFSFSSFLYSLHLFHGEIYKMKNAIKK